MTAQRYDEAERQLRQAIRLNPKLVKANYQLGLLLARTGRKDEANDSSRSPNPCARKTKPAPGCSSGCSNPANDAAARHPAGVGRPACPGPAGSTGSAPANRHTSPAPANVAELKAPAGPIPTVPKHGYCWGWRTSIAAMSAKALEALQRAVKTGPQSAEAHDWLGVALADRSPTSRPPSQNQESNRAGSAVRTRISNLGY